MTRALCLGGTECTFHMATEFTRAEHIEKERIGTHCI